VTSIEQVSLADSMARRAADRPRHVSIVRHVEW
jgi:hypothetical protein